MKLSLNWLKEYIDLPADITPEKLAQDLTMSTVEVEQIIDQQQQFEKMVVGKIVELKKHSNADKLKIAITDIGDKQPAQIVCGGINLKEKMWVVVALPGAQVRWHGTGDLLTLEEAKIRGEKSFGMICAAAEIGLADIFPAESEVEIIDLSNLKNIKPGQKISEVLNLNDVILEIDNKSLTNRPDLWNHYGIARELAAIYKINLKPLKLSKIREGKDKHLSIDIKDKKLCPRYMGCVVENIKIEKSPDWLIKKLEAVGSRSINNIVDITNYVMQDVGEPMHAFDFNKIAKKSKAQINIRQAKKGETITTLDNETRKLSLDTLVIADNKKPIAIAGVMGGADSEVSSKTTSIVLEAANFDSSSVRKTSQKLDLRTEAVMRFEKNIDVDLAEIGMLRALELIKQICPQAKIHPIVDVNYHKQKEIIIKLEHDYLEKKIGQEFDSKIILDILNRLGFKVKFSKNVYKIKVPSWRATGDISIPEDIIEEIIRIYGYTNLKEKTEYIKFNKAKYQPQIALENNVKNYLSLGCGMSEVFNYPWAEQKILDKLQISTDNLIQIQNPPAEANKYLQPSLIPNLFKNIKDNLRYFDKFRIFELAPVFYSGESKTDGDDKLPSQPKMLAGAVVSNNTFLEIRGILENLLKVVGIKDWWLCFVKYDKWPNYYNSEKNLAIQINNKRIGWLGELKEKIKGKSVCLFEINFDLLAEIVKSRSAGKKYVPVPQYPSIVRDLAFEVEWGVKWSELVDVISNEVRDPVIKEITFLSEYDLGQKKSLAFRVTYQADRTLTDQEVENIQNKIIKLVQDKFGGELRK